MAQSDFYAVLGVSPTATADEIKKAYRRLAKQSHPDTNPGDAKAAERFKSLSEAYTVLGDATKRREYDEMRRLGAFEGFARPRGGGGPRRGPGTGAPGMPPDMGEFDLGGLGGLGEIFGSMFGGGAPRQPGPQKGASVETTLEVPFRTAARGGKVPLEFELDGARRKILVTIPMASESGSRIKLRGQGGAGRRGGPAGDLVITLQVQADPVFTRDGLDLIRVAPINVAQATLGTKLTVATLDDRQVTLTLPAGTSSGKRFRIRGQGIASGDRTGDLLIEVKVVVPEGLTDEQAALMRRFAEAAGLEL